MFIVSTRLKLYSEKKNLKVVVYKDLDLLLLLILVLWCTAALLSAMLQGVVYLPLFYQIYIFNFTFRFEASEQNWINIGSSIKLFPLWQKSSISIKKKSTFWKCNQTFLWYLKSDKNDTWIMFIEIKNLKNNAISNKI